jgi:hypothetical protein
MGAAREAAEVGEAGDRGAVQGQTVGPPRVADKMPALVPRAV